MAPRNRRGGCGDRPRDAGERPGNKLLEGAKTPGRTRVRLPRGPLKHPRGLCPMGITSLSNRRSLGRPPAEGKRTGRPARAGESAPNALSGSASTRPAGGGFPATRDRTTGGPTARGTASHLWDRPWRPHRLQPGRRGFDSFIPRSTTCPLGLVRSRTPGSQPGGRGFESLRGYCLAEAWLVPNVKRSAAVRAVGRGSPPGATRLFGG